MKNGPEWLADQIQRKVTALNNPKHDAKLQRISGGRPLSELHPGTLRLLFNCYDAIEGR
jgi:hypothetical protein